MRCLLCGYERNLAKAHIMPDSMNRVLRRVLDDDSNSPMLTFDKLGKTKRYPMGTYDKQIVCGECDGGFSPWEKHATDVLFTQHTWSDLRYDRNGIPLSYRLVNAEYKPLKLFMLSLLWKTSVSTLTFCRGVALDPTTNDCIGAMLRSGDPGTAADFAVRVCQFYRMDAALTFESREEDISGMHHVVMYLPGYKLLVNVDDKRVALDPVVLRPDGTILVKLLNFQGSPERRSLEKMAAKM